MPLDDYFFLIRLVILFHSIFGTFLIQGVDKLWITILFHFFIVGIFLFFTFILGVFIFV